MKVFIEGVICILIVVFLGGCTTLRNGGSSELNIKLLNKIVVGQSSKVDVTNLIGPPKEGENNNWIYFKNGSEKLRISFNGKTVKGLFLSVWDTDKPKDVESLLKYIPGNWSVLKEPMSNPHRGPDICFLEDLKGGKRVKINGYSKKIEHISVWTPDKGDVSIKSYLHRNVGKEFCIAGSCSKVSAPKAWDVDHCAWLRRLVK